MQKKTKPALILDVGSGHKPHLNATHLCDLYFSNDERGFDLIVDRPFVRGSLEYLPFKYEAFEFVYACHVLEHVKKPGLAFAELSRVAKSGYIECPSYFNELAYGWSFHKWVISCKANRLYCIQKPNSIKIVNLHRLYACLSAVRILHYFFDIIIGCMYMRVYWRKTSNVILSNLSLIDRINIRIKSIHQ